MKKIQIFLVMLAAIMVLASCAKTDAPSSSQSQSEAESSQEPSSSAAESSSEDTVKKDIYVADAAMYRGTLTEISQENGVTVLNLKQAEGTNFGAAKLRFAVTENTRLDFQPEKGQYVEVYYSPAMNQPIDPEKTYDIITATAYLEEAMVVFNGTVKELPSSDSEKNRFIVMAPLDDPEDEVIFNFSKEGTKLYLNLSQVKVGDKLNIFTNGVMTMSLPPQRPALEIRKYAE